MHEVEEDFSSVGKPQHRTVWGHQTSVKTFPKQKTSDPTQPKVGRPEWVEAAYTFCVICYVFQQRRVFTSTSGYGFPWGMTSFASHIASIHLSTFNAFQASLIKGSATLFLFTCTLLFFQQHVMKPFSKKGVSVLTRFASRPATNHDSVVGRRCR